MCLIEHCWLLVTSLLMETVGESTEVGSQPAMLVWEFVCWCLCGPFPLYMLICEIVYTLACVYPNICETECVCAAPCADALFVCPFLSRLGWHTVPQSSSLSLLPSLYCCPLVFPVTWLRCDTYSPLTPILHLSSTTSGCWSKPEKRVLYFVFLLRKGYDMQVPRPKSPDHT